MKRLSNKVKILLNKSKESCLLAVEVYNKPLVTFKSGGFVVLMIIAWTSLFHAILEKNNINYYYKEKNGYFYKKDKHGNKLAWSLADSLDYYFKNIDEHKNVDSEAIKENLTFFIDFRNEFEHHFLPELDELVFGKCQALLNNYEQILVNEFGREYIIEEDMSFALQFTYLKEKNFIPSDSFKKIKKQIATFDNALSNEIVTNERYSFNVYLIQVSNSKKAQYAINFIHENELTPEALGQLESATVITKDKKINVSNKGNLKPKAICNIIEKRLSQQYNSKVKFSTNNLNKFCEKFQIKFVDKNGQKRTNSEYCVYDEVYDQFSYTPKFADFVLRRFKDKNKFIEMFPNQKKDILNLLSSKEVSVEIEKQLQGFYKDKSITFGVNFHSRCCKHYRVKFKRNGRIICDENYCLTCGSNSYAFTKEWVDYLLQELKNKDNFNFLFPNHKIK